jgi:hypothetical protein
MDKGQHLRLVFMEGATPSSKVIALATDMTFHLSAQTEDSSTKDTTDTNGAWNEYDVTARSGDIQFNALVGVGSDTGGKSFADLIDQVSDSLINWKVVMVSGAENRVVGKEVCHGQGKLTNLQASAQNRQKATYSGTLNIYGTVVVGSD